MLARAHVATTRVILTAQTLVLLAKSMTPSSVGVRAYAVPNESIAITATFFLASILTLSTMGIGRNRIRMSAMTSVY
jgi:hypothetical protein